MNLYVWYKFSVRNWVIAVEGTEEEYDFLPSSSSSEASQREVEACVRETFMLSKDDTLIFETPEGEE